MFNEILTVCGILLTIIDDIISSILPPEEHDELPVGFSTVGHIGNSISPKTVTPDLH